MGRLRICLFATSILLLVILNSALVESHAGHDHAHDHGHHHGHAHGHAHHHHDHDHDHDHEHEPPSFKYSRQANAPPKAQPAHSHNHAHHSHDHSGHSHGHVHQKPAVATQRPAVLSKANIWLYALGSTLAISLAPFLILFFIHIDVDSPYLRVLLAFASGGLLGDAFLHLIPHSVPHSHGHHDDHDHGHGEEEHDHFAHTMVGVWVVAGIISFLVVEKILRHMQGGDAHSHDHGNSHSHSHSHEEREKSVTADLKAKKAVKDEKDEDSHPEGQKKNTKSSSEDDAENESDKKKERGDSVVRETKEVKRVVKEKGAAPESVKAASGDGDIKVGGYLNLVADFAHNFTDGLAIGATYMAGHNIGLWTSFIILCHEIPHEIGDYALLVQSGCPRYKAILLQLVTALGAFLGCFLSLFLGSTEAQGKSSWVIPFTAGGFIYIGTVTIIPELLAGGSIKQSIVELLAILSGIGIMFMIAIYEGDTH